MTDTGRRTPLPPTINLNPTLFEFNASRIVLNNQEAWCVLAYFFYHPGIQPTALNENDLSFAQALTIEAIEQSYRVNFLWHNRPQKPIYLSKEMNKIVISVLKKTGGHWNWTAAVEALLKHHEKYELNYLVQKIISAAYFIHWKARVTTGIPAYHGTPAA